MKPFDRNASILEHIISYCDQIQQTVERFGDDYALFESDPIYRNATALCILQIGELVGMLTDDFRGRTSFCTLAADQGYAEYRCPQLRLCCPETTWEIITGDIPDLNRYCQAILENNACPKLRPKC